MWRRVRGRPTRYCGGVVPHTGIAANVRRVPAEYGCYGGLRPAPVDSGRLEGTSKGTQRAMAKRLTAVLGRRPVVLRSGLAGPFESHSASHAPELAPVFDPGLGDLRGISARCHGRVGAEALWKRRSVDRLAPLKGRWPSQPMRRSPTQRERWQQCSKAFVASFISPTRTRCESERGPTARDRANCSPIDPVRSCSSQASGMGGGAGSLGGSAT
jgi:hypothetical protein